MPQTPDRHPGALDEEEIQFEDRAADGDPTVTGAMRFVSGAFRLRDSIGVFNPRTGINVGEDLDFLLVSEPPEPGTDYAVTRSSGVVTFETWTRTGGNKLKDIEYTRGSGVVTQEDRKIYASDGTTILAHLRVTYTRTSGQVTSGSYQRIV